MQGPRPCFHTTLLRALMAKWRLQPPRHRNTSKSIFLLSRHPPWTAAALWRAPACCWSVTACAAASASSRPPGSDSTWPATPAQSCPRLQGQSDSDAQHRLSHVPASTCAPGAARGGRSRQVAVASRQLALASVGSIAAPTDDANQLQLVKLHCRQGCSTGRAGRSVTGQAHAPLAAAERVRGLPTAPRPQPSPPSQASCAGQGGDGMRCPAVRKPPSAHPYSRPQAAG